MSSKKKKYMDGLEETTENIISHNSIIELNQNPNIILSTIDVYQTNYNYSNIESEQDRNDLYRCEVIIADKLKQLTHNFKEVCEKLYHAQNLLANHDKTNGMFYHWFESFGLDKNFVYRCIERYKLYIESRKDVYLSQNVPIRTIQLLKGVETNIKIEIADLLSKKEITTTTGVQNYLVSHVRQDSSATIKEEKYYGEKYKIVKSNNQISIKLKLSLKDEELKKLIKYMEEFIINNS